MKTTLALAALFVLVLGGGYLWNASIVHMPVIIHVFVIIVTGLIVLYADEQALLWVLGKKSTLSKARIDLLHRSVSIGLALLLITGGLLYVRGASFYLSQPAFVIKMIAIAALIFNTYFIGKFGSVAMNRTFSSLTSSERRPLFVSGAVSALGWITAIICGLTL